MLAGESSELRRGHAVAGADSACDAECVRMTSRRELRGTRACGLLACGLALAAPACGEPPAAVAEPSPRPAIPEVDRSAASPSRAEGPAPIFAAGDDDTCLLTTPDEFACWGSRGSMREALPAFARPAKDLRVGSGDRCTLKVDGTVACWRSAVEPLVIPELAGVTALDITSSHHCAATGDAIVCWDGREPEVRIAVADARSVVAAGAGNGGCALRGDGSVHCWAQPPCSDAAQRWALPGVTGVVDIAATNSEMCAVQGDGTVACFEFDGCWTADAASRRRVETRTDARQVALGERIGCILHADRSVSCWDPRRDTETIAPVPVPGLELAVAVTVGRKHACARTTSSGVVCWADNHARQLGEPYNTPIVSPPRPLVGITDAVELEAWWAGGCVVRADGSVWCWGRYAHGGWEGRPRPLHGVHLGARGLVMRGDYACVRSPAQSPVCWTSTTPLRPMPWPDDADRPISHIRLSGRPGQGCALYGDDSAACTWLGAPSTRGREEDLHWRLRRVRDVEFCGDGLCAIDASGEIRCTLVGSDEPVSFPFSTLAEGAELRCDLDLACVLAPGESPRCAPHRASARPPEGQFPAGNVIVEPTDGELVFGTRGGVACVRRESGEVGCWGEPGREHWWLSAISAPSTTIPGLHGVQEVAVGGDHGCARKDGAVHCWGNSREGEAGVGSSQSPATPVQVGLTGPGGAEGVASPGS